MTRPTDYLHILAQHLLPQHVLSRLAGVVTNCQIPWFKNWLIDKFIAHYGVDMSCAIETNPHNHSNFNSFFTRHLKPETRPIVKDEDTIACPVDGTVSQAGIIDTNSILQAKNFTYDVRSLLGGSETRAAPFVDGHFATLYLAPKDYHRVHMPLAGKLREMIYVPGRLFSVNAATANHVESLFARNERVITIFDTTAGSMAIVLVGAMLVASISTVWAGVIAPRSKQPITWQYGNHAIELNHGDELGHFQLGSTVIVLFGHKKVEWALQPQQTVQFGQAIGKVCT